MLTRLSLTSSFSFALVTLSSKVYFCSSVSLLSFELVITERLDLWQNFLLRFSVKVRLNYSTDCLKDYLYLGVYLSIALLSH